MKCVSSIGTTITCLLLVSPVAASVVEVRGHNGQAIAAALQQANPGDTVQLGGGRFELLEPLRPKSQVKLVGAGQDKTRLVYKGSKPGVVVSLAGCEDVEIAHFAVDGEENPQVYQGISGSNSRRLWLHHLTICNLKAKTWGPHAILFSGRNPTMEGGVTDSRITDCRIENIGRDSKWGAGIRLAWGSVRNEVVGNTIHNTGRGGIFGDHSAELVIRNNRVDGSGGEGLGIEIWGGCRRSLIEDNQIDHWLSVDSSDQSAVRRNVVGAGDGTLKGYGIEIIARDMVVTDNLVRRGAKIGLSVSNKPVKNNVYWANNRVAECIQWGAQLQGESGGIAHHYFYRCAFEKTVRGDPRATYPDSGHGFRTNGSCRGLAFEECRFCDNGGHGVQLGGRGVDRISFSRCDISGNGGTAVTRPAEYTALEFADCRVCGNKSDALPDARPFSGTRPRAEFQIPEAIRAGQAVSFACASSVADGRIVDRLWDFGRGIPETTTAPTHIFDHPGHYRVTLIVWSDRGRGARVEKTIQVLPKS